MAVFLWFLEIPLPKRTLRVLDFYFQYNQHEKEGCLIEFCHYTENCNVAMALLQLKIDLNALPVVNTPKQNWSCKVWKSVINSTKRNVTLNVTHFHLICGLCICATSIPLIVIDFTIQLQLVLMYWFQQNRLLYHRHSRH